MSLIARDYKMNEIKEIDLEKVTGAGKVSLGAEIAGSSMCGNGGSGRASSCNPSDPEGVYGRPDSSQGDGWSGNRSYGGADGR